MKKCYIFVKFSGKSAKRIYSSFKFLHTSSHILHKTQRTQAILDGIKSLFSVVLLKKENSLAVVAVKEFFRRLSGLSRDAGIPSALATRWWRWRIGTFFGHIPPFTRYGIKIRSEIQAAPMPMVKIVFDQYSLSPLFVSCLRLNSMDSSYLSRSILTNSESVWLTSVKYSSSS